VSWVVTRSVRLEHRAEAALDDACASLPRAEEAWLSLEWLLARRPVRGLSRVVADTKFTLYAQDSDHVAGTPKIVVLYTYDDDQVQVYGLKFYPYEPPNGTAE
jgi:hypothetical protein